MHQDASFAGYLVPKEMITCWVALDDTQAAGGTIELVRGSHLWPQTPPDRGSFHAPDDWLAPLAAATPEGVEPERVPVVVKAGGCEFHHGWTFHGSGPNEATRERRALVTHMTPVEARFHPDEVDLIYSRYRRRGDLSLDESFFPVLWDENGGRSAWLASLPELPEGLAQRQHHHPHEHARHPHQLVPGHALVQGEQADEYRYDGIRGNRSAGERDLAESPRRD